MVPKKGSRFGDDGVSIAIDNFFFAHPTNKTTLIARTIERISGASPSLRPSGFDARLGCSAPF